MQKSGHNQTNGLNNSPTQLSHSAEDSTP